MRSVSAGNSAGSSGAESWGAVLGSAQEWKVTLSTVPGVRDGREVTTGEHRVGRERLLPGSPVGE